MGQVLKANAPGITSASGPKEKSIILMAQLNIGSSNLISSIGDKINEQRLITYSSVWVFETTFLVCDYSCLYWPSSHFLESFCPETVWASFDKLDQL